MPIDIDNDKAVGFKKETETIINQLIHGSKEREVVLITGMGGLGKTTLVKRVYEEKNVVNYFDKRAWYTVSQEYDYKDLLCKIYNQVCGKGTEIDSVAEEFRKKLMGMRYLIVLDDIWSVEAWEELNRVFPECNNGSRIVLTSRQESVVSDAKHICLPFFTIDESWELLQVKLFKGKGCPKELENVGREISNKCKGLPLTVGLIAGLLEKVEKTFPEDKEIEVSKLIELWISEGFIEGMVEIWRVEDEAEDYLNHLVSSNLIMVYEKGIIDHIKVCRVHDLVRDFCLTKAREEIFLEIINNMEKKWDPTLNFTPHRMCLHLQALNVDGDEDDDADDVSPLSLENLEYLITLKLESKKVHFPFFFWNMRRLRHMSISGVACDDSCKEKSRSVMIEAIHACSKELQTWCWECPLTPNHECLLRELPGLRTLSCFVSSSESFPKIDFLPHLEKLKLYCDNGRPHLLNDLKLSKFPSSVKEIDLFDITLSVSAISTIAQLPNLETLLLFGCAFEEGLTWNMGEETKFQKLKCLKLVSFRSIGIWNISSAAESFPCLEQLDLVFCSRFKVMPSGFEDVLTLKMISSHFCNPIIDSWVKEIEECARDLGNEQLQVDILNKACGINSDSEDEPIYDGPDSNSEHESIHDTPDPNSEHE